MNKILGVVASILAMCPLLPSQAAQTSGPAIVIRADKSVLVSVTRFDGKIIAVGERGLVMQSTDEGKTWAGVLTSTNRTLNSVLYLGDKVGIAAGHGGTLLRTEDDGATWSPVKIPEIGTDSILGLSVLSDGRVIACGAFGMYLESGDKGRTWVRKRVIRDDFDRHISRVIDIGGGKLFLVGETGTLAISSDMGETWKALKNPYVATTSVDTVEGSFFGVLRMSDGALLIYGMRGRIYRSTDEGGTWTLIPIASTNAINGGAVGPDGKVVLVGNNGLIATSSDAGKNFVLQLTSEGGSPIGDALFAKDGAIVYVGYLSTGRIETPALKN